MKIIDIKIPQKYRELSDKQLEIICYAVIKLKYEDVIKGVLMNLTSKEKKILLKNTTQQILIDYIKPFFETMDLYKFPKIQGVIEPADRLADLSIHQFSVIDSIFWKLKKDGYNNKKLIKQLVASLYRLQQGFDKLLLPKVADITDAISEKKGYVILYAYICCRQFIVKKYPLIFPNKATKEEENSANFYQNKYIPFSKVITAMALGEVQPLGNWHQCTATRIFDFFDVMEEQLIRTKK